MNESKFLFLCGFGFDFYSTDVGKVWIKPFGSILVIEDLIGIINKLDVCGCVCMGQDDLEEKFVWKSFSFVLFGAMRGDGGKKYRPIWDEAIERPRSPSGAHDINKKTADWNHKEKEKGDHRSRGGTLVLLIFLIRHTYYY